MYENINMNFSKRVMIDTSAADWKASPLPGVKRRMLERQGAESGRATSVVRYAPGSDFAAHTHTGGEEFILLNGVFSDDSGDYSAGSYVRNPVGSSHRPFSKPGCTIFVKLGQVDPDDQAAVRVDTKSAAWRPGLVDGLSVMPLHSVGMENIALVRWVPDTQFTRHYHIGGEENFVLDGVFEDEAGRYPAGTWLRNPAGSVHTPFSTAGCTIYVKTGHLGS